MIGFERRPAHFVLAAHTFSERVFAMKNLFTWKVLGFGLLALVAVAELAALTNNDPLAAIRLVRQTTFGLVGKAARSGYDQVVETGTHTPEYQAQLAAAEAKAKREADQAALTQAQLNAANSTVETNALVKDSIVKQSQQAPPTIVNHHYYGNGEKNSVGGQPVLNPSGSNTNVSVQGPFTGFDSRTTTK